MPRDDDAACEAPNQCATPAEVNAAADVLCRRARIAEDRIDEYRDAAALAERNEAICYGRLEQLAANPPRPARSPWWLRVGLDVLAPSAAVAGGVCVGRCPDEVTVGALVLSGAAAVGRLVIEVVDD